MRARLFLIILVTSILPMLIVNHVSTRSYLSSEISDSISQMESEARILMDQLTQAGYFEAAPSRTRELNDALIDQMAENWSGRIRIVDSHLKIIKDTYSRDTGKYFIADDVLAASQGGYEHHYDSGTQTMYFAEPILSMDGSSSILGVVVVNADMQSVEKPIRSQQRTVQVLEVICILALVVIDLLLLYATMRPLNTLAQEISNAADSSSKPVRVYHYRETARISDAFNRTQEKLQALDQSRQEFVSNVAHELKTPITSMRVLADSLMTMDSAPVELYQDFMKDISEEIDRESKIIDDLLSLSRLDNNAVVLNIERTNVNEKMELILKRLAPIAKVRHIELLFESYRPVIADIDEVKLTLAVTNLVENAIKYNKDNGWVKVSLNADYQYFYIKVSDSGVGIPEDALSHIFERFYRVDKARSRETGGTGLGLSISKSIVTLHHGEIRAYSKYGEGTTFVIRIPLHYVSEKEEQ